MNDYTRHYFPENYAHEHKVVVLPTKITSIEAHYQHWLKHHRNDYIELQKWDEPNEESEDIEEDEILVEAALGGDPDADIQYFCVKRDKYREKRTEFGYIIDFHDKHMETINE